MAIKTKKNRKNSPITPIKNITCNIPSCYEKNIQWLIDPIDPSEKEFAWNKFWEYQNKYYEQERKRLNKKRLGRGKTNAS